MKLFGMIVPPISPQEEALSEPQDTQNANWPKYLIALDNTSYKVLELTSSEADDSQSKIRDLATIHTGIGGHMPRYVTQVIDEGQNFSMVTLC